MKVIEVKSAWELEFESSIALLNSCKKKVIWVSFTARQKWPDQRVDVCISCKGIISPFHEIYGLGNCQGCYDALSARQIAEFNKSRIKRS